MYELPPMLRGTEQQQLQALRDYLVRTVQNMEKRMDEKEDSWGKRLSEEAESAAKSAGALEERLARLEKRVSELEGRVTGPEGTE